MKSAWQWGSTKTMFHLHERRRKRKMEAEWNYHLLKPTLSDELLARLSLPGVSYTPQTATGAGGTLYPNA